MADFTEYPELIRAIKNTKYVDNPHACAGFHPAKMPEDYAPKSGGAHALKVFAELVRNITDADYGDFMRKANGYLCDLKSQLKNAPTPIQKKLDEMQSYTQFNPSWNVESTRRRLLKDSEIVERWFVNLMPARDFQTCSLRRRDVSNSLAA
ncbi:MAG TPA: hypothetical protein PL182_02470 [Pseudobdellovibrionaceae bacterium]|nr:hypothetical protein [Pseudobdellovibrionaceae bacterium]